MIPRTISVGEEFEANAGFFEAGIPVPSINSALYPTYTITFEGFTILEGIGTYNDTDKLYHMSGTIPINSTISSEAEKYQIKWDLVSEVNKSYSFIEVFDVNNPAFTEITNKETQKLALINRPLILSLPLLNIPQEISLVLEDNGDLVYTGSPVQKGIYNDYYIYNVTIPKEYMTVEQEYQAIWDFMIAGVEATFFQKVYCCSTYSLSILSDLRMYLDKVAKSVDLYTGYKDSDLYFHLKQGLAVINLIMPITTWNFNYIKQNTLDYALLQGACYSALKAQYLAEGDSAFSYSGQPVTLEVDRTAFVESELSRIETWLNGEFKLAKADQVKRLRIGHLGLTRPSISGLMGGGNKQNILGGGIPYR